MEQSGSTKYQHHTRCPFIQSHKGVQWEDPAQTDCDVPIYKPCQAQKLWLPVGTSATRHKRNKGAYFFAVLCQRQNPQKTDQLRSARTTWGLNKSLRSGPSTTKAQSTLPTVSKVILPSTLPCSGSSEIWMSRQNTPIQHAVPPMSKQRGWSWACNLNPNTKENHGIMLCWQNLFRKLLATLSWTVR